MANSNIHSTAMNYLIVMAGGSGTRFWPKSTAKTPKQLLNFGSQKSLLAQTLARFEGIVPEENQIIVTTESLKDAVRKHVSKSVQVLAEPQGRNTAPCVYWAARVIHEKNPKGVMMVMPADHSIGNLEAFRKTITEAADYASKHDQLVTLGIKPDRPETGYGYLKMGKKLDGHFSEVDAFVEKPDTKKAEEFFKSGQYLWNGGMFLWKTETILKEFDRHMPDMKKAWENAKGNVEKAYPNLTATSIDYGVMEKAKEVVSFTLDCGWDDLGSWTSLENLADRLGARMGSNIVSAGNLVTVDSKHNIVDAQGKLVALLGVENLIVVESGDAILVARKDRAQDIRLIVEQVKKNHPQNA
jgi:mannose-1-phosphate guanylyltransferase